MVHRMENVIEAPGLTQCADKIIEWDILFLVTVHIAAIFSSYNTFQTMPAEI